MRNRKYQNGWVHYLLKLWQHAVTLEKNNLKMQTRKTVRSVYLLIQKTQKVGGTNIAHCYNKVTFGSAHCI